MSGEIEIRYSVLYKIASYYIKPGVNDKEQMELFLNLLAYCACTEGKYKEQLSNLKRDVLSKIK